MKIFDESADREAGVPGARFPYATTVYAQRRELFSAFLDEAEQADVELSMTMARRARRIDALRRVSVTIAADESAEDESKPSHLRHNGHPESGWSIENRAKTELATEIAFAFNLSKSAARQLLAESEVLVAELPLTLAALESGAIRYEHAKVIATTAWSVPPEARAALEAELVPLAQRMVVSVFRARAQQARERLHSESMQQRHEKAVTMRNVSLDLGEDGLGYLTLCDSNEVLAAIYNRVTDIALPKVKDDPRSLNQRRADVASEILLKGDLCAVTIDAESTDGDNDDDLVSHGIGTDGKRLGHGIVAQVHVEIPVLTLLGVESAPATLEGKVPIDPQTARRLVADAPGLYRLLTDPISGSVIAFDDKFRFLPRSLRRAVRLVDGNCTGPWCSATANECEGHHPEEWCRSHNTSLANSALVCKPDHNVLHNTRWTMIKLPNGDKQWNSPSGRMRIIPPLRRLSPAFVEALGPPAPDGAPAAADSWYEPETESDTDQQLPF